jgi:hypothetical protein
MRERFLTLRKRLPGAHQVVLSDIRPGFGWDCENLPPYRTWPSFSETFDSTVPFMTRRSSGRSI